MYGLLHILTYSLETWCLPYFSCFQVDISEFLYVLCPVKIFFFFKSYVNLSSIFEKLILDVCHTLPFLEIVSHLCECQNKIFTNMAKYENDYT